MDYPLITYTVDANDLCIDENEVLRYLGYSKVDITTADKEMIMPMIEAARSFVNPKACYRRFDIETYADNRILLPYGEVTSRHLTLNLNGCKSIYMIAATIGAPFDRQMIKARVSSMAKAAILQAIGATYVESLVEKLVEKLSKEASLCNEKLRVRYSPGFGDYDLSNQKGLFKVLTPEKHAGITLNDSLIMSPEKSVTALIGIEKI